MKTKCNTVVTATNDNALAASDINEVWGVASITSLILLSLSRQMSSPLKNTSIIITKIPEALLIKSTILPNMLEVYEENVVYSPEFLREAHAKKDFKNNEHVLWGGLRSEAEWWIDRFNCHHKTNVIMNKKDASTIKYVYNCFLATKVAFFHELYSKLDKSYNYHMITNTLADFENIGSSHMRVKELGYDGNCFPKDMEAFANFLDSEILKNVIKVNKDLVSSR